MKRLSVIYVRQPDASPYWEESSMATIRPHHDVHILDREQPIKEQFPNVDAVVQMGAYKVPAEYFEAARGVKLWQLLSVGYDKFNTGEALAAGIPLCHCPGSTSSSGLAEGALMFMMLILKEYNLCQNEIVAGNVHNPMGQELEGKLLGLVGFGASGHATARLAKAFGMRIAISEPMEIDQATLDEFEPEFVVKPDDMTRIFEEADVVSLHLPLTPETHGCINADLIGRMKPTACFINMARGDLVDQDTLYAALLENRIFGIGTDVHAGVNPDYNHPVYQHPNFYATPHTSGTTLRTADRRAKVALENLNRVAAGDPLHHLIEE